MTSPSCTMYSLPSRRSCPRSRASFSPPADTKASKATVSARMKPFSKSLHNSSRCQPGCTLTCHKKKLFRSRAARVSILSKKNESFGAARVYYAGSLRRGHASTDGPGARLLLTWRVHHTQNLLDSLQELIPVVYGQIAIRSNCSSCKKAFSQCPNMLPSPGCRIRKCPHHNTAVLSHRSVTARPYSRDTLAPKAGSLTHAARAPVVK
jgi:hypothetical protein